MHDNLALQFLVAHMPGHVYWKSAEGVYLGCNDRQAKSLGLEKASDVIGKTDHDLPWSAEVADAFRANDMEVMESGKTLLVEEESIIDGQPRIVLSEKIPVRSEQGEIVGILGISIDITEIKNLQAQLLESETREARLKTMSAIGGMIAHELRTPLLGIKSAAQHIHSYLPQLLAGYEAASALGKVINPIRQDHLGLLKESLTDIERAVNYCQSTINTILSGLQHTTGDSKISTHSVLLADVVKKAIEDYPMQSSQRDLITASVEENLTCMGQEDVIIGVLHNLLKNALQAIDSVKKGTIKIEASLKSDHVELTFYDTAKGIAPEHLVHIFDAFYSTKQRASQSVGLGLYFCKIALQRMNADITCESEVGQYTKFIIKFAH